ESLRCLWPPYASSRPHLTGRLVVQTADHHIEKYTYFSDVVKRLNELLVLPHAGSPPRLSRCTPDGSARRCGSCTGRPGANLRRRGPPSPPAAGRTDSPGWRARPAVQRSTHRATPRQPG